MFTRYAEQYGGTSAAARALMEAELARQSLGPNRSFSDGTGVPVTFEPLRQKHQRDASVIDSKMDVDAQGRTGEAAVAKSKLDPVASRPASDSLNDTRGKVLQRGTSIRQDVQDRGEVFDQQTGPTRSDDGTLVSQRSLLKRTAKQVGGDAKASLESAKDAVKDVFRKK